MRRRRRLDPIRSIGLLVGFNSLADGFESLGEGMGNLMGVGVDDPDGPSERDGGGKWIYKKKPPHPCLLPDLVNASEGDLWQCGVCGSQWIVTKGKKDKLTMMRTQVPTMWSTPFTTGTSNWGYTTYTTTPYWYSETQEQRGDPSDG